MYDKVVSVSKAEKISRSILEERNNPLQSLSIPKIYSLMYIF